MKKALVFLVLLAVLMQLGQGVSNFATAQNPPVEIPAQVAGSHTINQTGNLLYPDDIDPPESCNVPSKSTLGQDVEIMLGPWYGPQPLVSLDQGPVWNVETPLSASTASSDPDIVSLTTEMMVAVWRNNTGMISYATWGVVSGWSSAQNIGAESADGKPAIISRGPKHWAAFALFGSEIRIAEWSPSGLGPWTALPGVTDAVSDPAAITRDPGHMAVFYKDAGGIVKFTEWEGAWLTQPVDLGGGLRSPVAISSALSAVSRSDTHVAVFGVDANHQLWVRERLNRNQPDWSDTAWVMLLEDVEIAKPGSASRHANHIGVVVKNTASQPVYLQWHRVAAQPIYLPLIAKPATLENILPAPETQDGKAKASTQAYGWNLDPLGDEVFSSPLTLVPRSLDSLSALGVRADGILYENIWTEASGWGNWQAITSAGLKTDQVIAVEVRRLQDIMLLGRYEGPIAPQIWFKNYSNLDQPVTDVELSSTLNGHPRAQALSIVDGKTVWTSVTRDDLSGIWQVKAHEISTGVNGAAELGHADSSTVTNRVAAAASDLDLDGSAEVVVATLPTNPTSFELSVIEISFPSADSLVVTTTQYILRTPIPSADDITIAVGDLDGDSAQNEVVVGYNTSTAMQFEVFQHDGSSLVRKGNPTTIPYENWCPSGCSITGHDLEIAIGRVVSNYIQPFEREQLVVLDVADINTGVLHYAQDWVGVLISTTLTLDLVSEHNLLDPDHPGPASSVAADPYTGALDTGDIDASGLNDIVYSFGDKLVVITSTLSSSSVVKTGLPDVERSITIGDIDLDGRKEIGAGYRETASTAYYMFETVEGPALRVSAQRTFNGGRTLLAGDMDNDTRISELAGCKSFDEYHVIAVLNGAPRWYSNGVPIQNTGAEFGRTHGDGGGTSDGTSWNAGASLTVGYEHEFSVPITAIKIAEFRIGLTEEVMWSGGTKTTEVTGSTAQAGYTFGNGEPSLGMVVYNITRYKCYYYNVYPPSDPLMKTRAMLCSPTGRPAAENFMALEDWNSTATKQEAGTSWVEVGHRSPAGLFTNDLGLEGNYAPVLPVEPAQVYRQWDLEHFSPFQVSYSSVGGLDYFWSITELTGGESESTRAFEENTTLSVGATIFVIKVDVEGTYGRGWESSDTVSWEDELEIGGSVEKFPDPNKPDYDLVPYVYIARAVTGAGVVYKYLEMDYYVPWVGKRAVQEVSNPLLNPLLSIP